MENIKEKPIKLLILSYHYLPFNVIASYRPAGFVEHLYKFGIYPTVVTHRWEQEKNGEWIVHDKKDKLLVEKDNKYCIIRIPRYKTLKGNILRFLEKYSTLRKIAILYSWITGNLDPGMEQVDSYMAFKNFLFDHLNSNKYDIIMGIYSPHHHIKLCNKLHKKFKIPFFIDYRDVWPANRIARLNYKPTFIEWVQDIVIRYYWKKWNAHALFFTVTSDYWNNLLKNIIKINGHVITNAYDKNLFNKIKKIKKDFFSISHIGTIYPNQDIESLFQAIKHIKENHINYNIVLNLIGVKKRMEKRIKSGICKYKLEDITVIEKRISREKALDIMYNSNILFYPTWPDTPGTYSGKIFEYLASDNKILAFPNDKSVIFNLLKETKTGIILNSIDEMIGFIISEYNKWEKTKNKPVRKKTNNLINKYSRENQTKILSKFLKTLDKV